MKLTNSLISQIIFAISFTALSISYLTRAQASAEEKRLTKNGLIVTKNAPAQLPETEIAGFAAGCFWGVEQEFRKEKGVIATAVGFAGGKPIPNLSYHRVCEGDTGHAETVLVEFDPKVVSYEKLLDLFWTIHDPTTPNRQGPDVGEQYRSVIFYYSPKQKVAAEKSKAALEKSGELRNKIVTEIVEGPQPKNFYKAEEYHQQYVEKGGFAMCHLRKPRK